MIKKPTVKSTTKIAVGAPLTLPAINNNHTVMQTTLISPILLPLKPSTLGQKEKLKKVTFEDVLAFLKTKTEDYWELQDQQLMFLEQLCITGDIRSIVTFLLEKFKVSRFKSYKMAMKTFISLMEQYLNGEVEYSALTTYLEVNVPNYASEHWYEEFNDIRRHLISALSLDPKNKSPEYALVDVIKSLVSSEVDTKDENGFSSYEDRKTCEAFNNYIIDLSQLIWEDKAKSLKILYGNNK